MRVLVVEDDPDLRRQLAEALGETGYAVDVADNGEDGHHLGDTEPYDAVILDLGLPVIDGVTVLERWRRAGREMPVLILTARDEWREKVAGFDAGADDYVTKPCGPLTIDTRTARVEVDGAVIKLTGHEYRLLAYFAHHQGKVVSRTELTEHLYDQDFDLDSNTIEVFVGRVRRKLGIDLIRTVRGLGYCLAPDDRDDDSR